MSIFSSLTYFLKRASLSLYQTTGSLTKSSSKLLVTENEVSNKLSLFVGNESSTVNTTSFSKYLHHLLGIHKLTNIPGINSSLETSTISSFLSSTSKAYFETEDTNTSGSNAQFPNETFPDADYLYESWWNVFDERYLRHGWGWTITLIVAYVLILVVGVIGNSMVILVVLLRPQMRTATNMFIMNLAVADLFVVMFCVPSTLLANIFTPWILSSFMCKAVAYVQGVSVCASAYSLAAISLDRCQAIYRNLERPCGFSQTICTRTVLVIWVAAIALTIPWAIVFTIKISEYDGLCHCVEIWENEKLGNVYFLVVNLICFYVIPLLLIFVSNWIIYFHVTRRAVPQDSASSAPIRKMHQQTRHDVLKMLGIVTLTFLFSWLPLYVLVIRIKFSEGISESEYNFLGIIIPLAQWLGSWNSSINPILYAFLNKKFRRMFKSILPAWIPVKATGQYHGVTGTPTCTTAYTGRALGRSMTNSKSDYHCPRPNIHMNSHSHTTLFVNRFQGETEKVGITRVQTILIRSPTTSVLGACTTRTLFDTNIAPRNTNSI